MHLLVKIEFKNYSRYAIFSHLCFYFVFFILIAFQYVYYIMFVILSTPVLFPVLLVLALRCP